MVKGKSQTASCRSSSETCFPASRRRSPQANKQVRDFLDVRDVGAGFVAITDSAVEKPVNPASGIGISVRSL
jgi:nucleoside-diphosphate-sugar epimerase